MEYRVAYDLLAAQSDETPTTMETPDAQAIRQEHERIVEALLARHPGVAEMLIVKHRPCGPFIRWAFQPAPESPVVLPPEEPEPPRVLPEMPDLSDVRWMAEQSYQNAVLFWWSARDGDPGAIFVLWADWTWEELKDESPQSQSGFAWLAEHVELGPKVTDEKHGEGCVKATSDGVWIVAPSDLDVFFLWADGAWELVDSL